MAIIDLSKPGATKSNSGNKALNLAVLHQNGIQVPRGYVVTSDESSRMIGAIRPALSCILDGPVVEPNAQGARDLMLRSLLPTNLAKELERILTTFAEETRFAVRSSGSCVVDGCNVEEDSATSSLAGQFESYLNVPAKHLGEAIKLCIASLFNARNLHQFYRRGDIGYLNSRMSVVIQEMVVSDQCAVMMTVDPTASSNVGGLEAAYGPCEALVSGKVTGDLIQYDRQTGYIVNRDLGSKEHQVVYNSFSSEDPATYYLEPIPEQERTQYALNRRQIGQLIETGSQIEQIFGSPQDIEAVFCGEELYVTQSRSVTALETNFNFTG